MMYIVTKSLTHQGHAHTFEFKGSRARINKEITSSYLIEFEGWGKICYLVDKDRFHSACKKLTDIGTEWEVHGRLRVQAEGIELPQPVEKVPYNIYVRDGDKDVHEPLIYWFDNTPTIYDVHKVLSINKVEILRHYSITFNKTEMAKTTKPNAIEEATIVSNENEAIEQKENTETGLVAVDLIEPTSLFPVITSEFTLGGIKVSPALVQKKVDEVLKLKLESDSDKKTYEIIKKKNAELVKTRTSTKKAREAVSKKITAWTSLWKKTVEDDITTTLAPGEEHCKKEMKRYEDWEAEELKRETEANELRVKERSQLLSTLQGVKNFDSGHWTFPYAPHLLIENDTLEREFGWDAEYEIIKKEFDQHIKNKEDEEAKSAQVIDSLISSRKMLLDMMGYTENAGSYLKDGHVVVLKQIRDLDDPSWKELIQSHKVPLAQAAKATPVSNPIIVSGATTKSPSNPFFSPTTPQATAASPVAQTAGSNPFTEFAASPEVQEVVQSVNMFALTSWEQPFVDAVLPQTTFRVYPKENEEEALNIANRDARTGYAGELGNGLFFILFSNA